MGELGTVGEVHPRVIWHFGGSYSVYVAVFQRKQHNNLSYTITLSPTTYYGVRTPTDMTYIATFTPKHTKNVFIRKEYVQHAPTLLESNRVAGSIPKI